MGGVRVGRKTLPTILIPKGVQRHPVNGWVPDQARPLYCHTYVPTPFTILAKVGSHSTGPEPAILDW